MRTKRAAGWTSSRKRQDGGAVRFRAGPNWREKYSDDQQAKGSELERFGPFLIQRMNWRVKFPLRIAIAVKARMTAA
jgi:hypothetical protein